MENTAGVEAAAGVVVAVVVVAVAEAMQTVRVATVVGKKIVDTMILTHFNKKLIPRYPRTASLCGENGLKCASRTTSTDSVEEMKDKSSLKLRQLNTRKMGRCVKIDFDN